MVYWPPQGSSGNSALIRSGGTSVVVDIGVSALQMKKRLAAFGQEPEDIDAIFLTHEHSDHIRGLDVFLRRHHPAPVWATRGTWSRVPVRARAGGELTPGRDIPVGGLRVRPVATSHDAAEPVRFTLLVDPLGSRRVWKPYKTLEVPPGKPLTHEFPAGFSAHWVRVRADAKWRVAATIASRTTRRAGT